MNTIEYQNTKNILDNTNNQTKPNYGYRNCISIEIDT